MAMAQSCGLANHSSWLLKEFPQAPYPWILPWELAVFRAGALQKSTAPNPPVKPRSASTLSPRPRSLAEPVPILTWNMRSIRPTLRAAGLMSKSLLISQPDTGEQALEIAETLVRSGAVDVVVINSVAALVPRAEIEGDMGDPQMGMQARLMSQALRKLSGAIKQTNTTVVFTNQLRLKIGVMFGNPETTTGGMALKFYASVRLDVRRIQTIKLGSEIIGNRTRVRVVKNKVAPPFREAEFDIMYSEGISKMGDILDLATTLEIVTKRGSFYSYGDIRLGQGRENSKDFLKQNPDLADEIELAIRQQALSGEIPMAVNRAEAEQEEDED